MTTLTSGIGFEPTGGEDDRGRRDDPHRAEQVCEDVTVRGLDVEAARPCPREDPSGGDVDPDSEGAEDEDPATEHVRRVAKALERLVEDPDRECDERDPVRERCQHLGPLVAVRPLGRRRTIREPDGEERQRERDVVGEHVHRVREQCEAAREQAADDFGNGVRGRDRECEGERVSAPRSSVIVHVGHGVKDCFTALRLERRVGQRHDPGVRAKVLAIVAVVALASAVAVVASAKTTANGLPSYTDGWQKWPRINQKPFTSRPGRSRAPTPGVKNVYASKRKVGSKYPNGTVIVKTIVKPGTKYVGQFATMRKVDGRWRYIEYERSSANARYSLLAQGSLCQSCHVMAKSNDFVFTKK